MVVYTAPALLVVPPEAALAFPKGPNLSQNMNHTSFPGANHNLDSFYHHVRMADKMYSTNFLLLHVITVLMSMPIDLTYATPWYTSIAQRVWGSRQ